MKADEDVLNEWWAKRDRYEKFSGTELGTLYRAHEHAMINYWRRDAVDNVPAKRLRELDARNREATDAFVAKLMELAGV